MRKEGVKDWRLRLCNRPVISAHLFFFKTVVSYFDLLSCFLPLFCPFFLHISWCWCFPPRILRLPTYTSPQRNIPACPPCYGLWPLLQLPPLLPNPWLPGAPAVSAASFRLPRLSPCSIASHGNSLGIAPSLPLSSGPTGSFWASSGTLPVLR